MEPVNIGGGRWMVRAALCAALVFLFQAAQQAEARERTYRVHGVVVAVTLNQTPPLIVVKTPLTPKNHMTVGATITPQTRIARDGKRVAIQAIRVGESVWLTYSKTSTGLLAKAIEAKG